MASTFMEPGSDATKDLSFFASTTGAVSSATDQAYSGTSSIKCDSGAGPTNAQFAVANGTFGQTGRQTLMVRFETLPATLTNFFLLRTSAPSNSCLWRLNSTGLLTVAPVGVAAVNGTAVISVNRWYRMTATWNVQSATVFTFNLYVDGVLDITVSSTGTLTNPTISNGIYGLGGAVGNIGANRVAWFDDIYADDGADLSDIGNIRVGFKRPFSNGSLNDFSTQIGSGGSGYGTGHAPQVNEVPLSQTNGWSMIGAGSAVTEEFNVEAAASGAKPYGDARIVDWMGWVFAGSVASETGQLVVRGVLTPIALTSTPKMFGAFAASQDYPLGIGTDVGIVTDAATLTTVSLYECGVLIAYRSETIGPLRVRRWN